MDPFLVNILSISQYFTDFNFNKSWWFFSGFSNITIEMCAYPYDSTKL